MIAPSQAEILAVEAARAGNPDLLIVYLYERLNHHAGRLVAGYQESYGSRLSLEDVVQEGMEWAWRRMPRGLQMHNPVSWLIRVAQLRMLRYCVESHSPIRVPYTSQREYGHRPPRCASLEAPIAGTDGLRLVDILQA
jgi:DNA-directed RNA polymerase specialized sigma24 family protein